jgi:two-component system LytT family response regulator
MKAIIIDDELNSREYLDLLLRTHCPTVELRAVCAGMAEGINAIRSIKPDLVFLDVEMPPHTGFQLLDEIGFPNIPFEVIFCTAHDHYAVQAFKYSAVDFLTKLIAPDDLMKAVMKAQKKLNDKQRLEYYEILKENILANQANPRMMLPALDGTYIVPTSDIIRIQAVPNRVMVEFILTNNRSLHVAKNLGEFEDLPPFIRVHRSHIINPNHVIRYIKNGDIEMADGYICNVTPHKREELMQWLTQNGRIKLFG